jgi:hypothetical protein
MIPRLLCYFRGLNCKNKKEINHIVAFRNAASSTDPTGRQGGGRMIRNDASGAMVECIIIIIIIIILV